MNTETIHPAGSVGGTIPAPASKSYAQRAIALAALAGGQSSLTHLTHCNDIDAALSAVSRLGAAIAPQENGAVKIGGPILNGDGACELNIGESGLSTRLFTPVASLFEAETVITGHGSILTRPIGNMEQPLRDLGVTVASNGGFLPLRLRGKMRGGEITLDGSLGSQFLTGLLIALPLIENDTILNVTNLKSIPYIDMTLEVIRAFGGEVTHEGYKRFYIRGGQHYRPVTYHIEGDWSGASALLAAGAVKGDNLRITNLDPVSAQADKAILQALDLAGANMSVSGDGVTLSRSALKGFHFDATHAPDLFPALVALTASAEGESRIAGTERLTHKESDRAKVLKEVYEAMGIAVDLSYDNLMIVRGGAIRGGMTLDSHNDHRIAMSIAVAALSADAPITVTGAEAVDKSYCEFWRDLQRIRK